ncbi:hypothetical protein H3C61_01525 [Candidatus Gracilibacteria bacterium]|nr:hypothetical protein [Candidatus Gracilibacteria bacterium]
MPFRAHTHKLKNFEISFSPKRGGIITSIKQDIHEILYLNLDTFNNPEKNVRGGIPLLFPNAGPLDNGDIYKLNQHGFVRNSIFEIESITSKNITLKLILEEKYKEVFPFSFEYKLLISTQDDFLKITQYIKNTGKVSMPVSPGFHPYFLVDNKLKKDVKFSFSGDNYFDIWSIGDTKELKNPGKFEVDFGEYILEFDYDKIFKYIWLWSEEGKDFLCIEPIYEKENGLLDNPFILGTGESVEMSMGVKIKK